MNKLRIAITSLAVAVFAISAFAVDAELDSKIKAFYKHHDEVFAQKELDAYYKLYSEDYQPCFGGPTLKQAKETMGELFEKHEQVRCHCDVQSIEIIGSRYLVIADVKIEYKNAGDAKWATLENVTEINLLEESGESYKFKGAGVTDKARLDNFKGSTYTDSLVGISFDVPEKWRMVPVAQSHMKGAAVMVDEDFNYSGLFAYVEVPYNVSAKNAVEGDDAAMNKIADQYKKLSSGPKNVGDQKGYESFIEFRIDKMEIERKRWRVYFEGGGLLYIMVFDAEIDVDWNQVKPKYQAILNSFSMSASAKKEGGAKLRQESAKGEVAGRIYTNSDIGCQIAAPQGWTMESTTTGDAFLFTVTMKPSKGDSVVRFMGVDTKGMIGLEKVVKQQRESIEKIVDNLKNGPLEEITVGGQPGNAFAQEFSMEGIGSLKRKTAMYIIKDILYMVICDAIPPENYDALEPQFDEIIQSMTIN